MTWLLWVLVVLARLAASQEEGGAHGPKVDPPSWFVRQDADQGEGLCLLADAEVRLELVDLVANSTREVSLPERVRLEGDCGPEKSEIRMLWKDRRSGEDNLLNLVVTRRNGHLVYLSGAFLRLHTGGEKEEFYSAMSALEYTTLLWPLRYQVACKDTLSYVMSPAEDTETQSHQAIVHLTNLRIEAFREVTLHDHRPRSLAAQWYRREWKCEFHRIFSWAPYLVGCGLTCTVIAMTVAFLCRNSMEKKRQSKYESL